MQKVIKGNDFTLRISLVRKYGGTTTPFELEACTKLVLSLVGDAMVLLVVLQMFQCRPPVAPVALAVAAQPLLAHGTVVIEEQSVVGILVAEAKDSVLQLDDALRLDAVGKLHGLLVAFLVGACLLRDKVEFQKLVLTFAVTVDVEIQRAVAVLQHFLSDADRLFDGFGFLHIACVLKVSDRLLLLLPDVSK